MKIIKLDKKHPKGTHKLQLPNKKEFILSLSHRRGMLICEELFLKDIVRYNPLDIPQNFCMRFEDSDKIRIEPFFFYGIDNDKNGLSIIFGFRAEYYLENENIKWAPRVILRAIKKEASSFKMMSIPYYKEGEGYIDDLILEIVIKSPYLKNLTACINYAKNCLQKLLNQTNIQLDNLSWNYDYEKNEKRFTTEILMPLFQKMGFENIFYNHGKDEYGKDITFQETDKFGIPKIYGVQVKAGNISGKNNTQIDSLIYQIDDAFKIPFIDLNSRNPQFVSTLIVACSGRFTHNAKEKIQHKLSRGLYGSVNFLDKEKIQELVLKYWNANK